MSQRQEQMVRRCGWFKCSFRRRLSGSWRSGKQLLELLGVSVAGPAVTTAAAESLLAQRLPDVALIDFHLRGGERSDGLIAQLR